MDHLKNIWDEEINKVERKDNEKKIEFKEAMNFLIMFLKI